MSCHAHGCPMPGTVSDAVHRNPSKDPTAQPNWFCRYHVGAKFELWSKITTGVRANWPAIQALMRLEAPVQHGLRPCELMARAPDCDCLPEREEGESFGPYVRRCAAHIAKAVGEGHRIRELGAGI